MEYVLGFNNTYQQTNSPLVVRMAYINQRTPYYKCVTTIDNIQLKTNDDNCTIINNNNLMCSKQGSYTVNVYDINNQQSTPFSFYVFNELFINTNNSLYNIIQSELPSIYGIDNEVNNVNNKAKAKTIQEVYRYIYNLFYNSVSSIGGGMEYNSNWELVYFGTNGLLKNFVYPAEIIKSMLQINTKVSTSVKDISIFLSRILFQMTGRKIPVSMVYDDKLRRYNINIYDTAIINGWLLDIPTKGELGITTVLTNRTQNELLWVIMVLTQRIVPCFTDFVINYLNYSDFELNFNIPIVLENDFIDNNTIYDAYTWVNNNNIFNTKGYILKNQNVWQLGIPTKTELGITTILS